MIIVMKPDATQDDIQRVQDALQTKGLEVHLTSSESGSIVTGLGGSKAPLDEREFRLLSGVADVVKVGKNYTLVDRDFHPENTVIEINGVEIGGNEVVAMAGPCSVETEEQIHTVARAVRAAGARILRGGAFKPRTSPYAFQGHGMDALRMMREAADENGMLVISEIMDPKDMEPMGEFLDIYQVGARNMQNFTLLRELGKAKKPVLLKRGISATLEELLGAAECMLAGGNPQVMLCERGIRTYETATRNTMDLSAIPILHDKTHLPIVADPSHGTGIRTKVAPMARASVAAGADAIIVEVHHNPEVALSDGAQSLYPDQFVELMDQCRVIAGAIGRTMAKRTVGQENPLDNMGVFGM